MDGDTAATSGFGFAEELALERRCVETGSPARKSLRDL
jgi:hypothetical protein